MTSSYFYRISVKAKVHDNPQAVTIDAVVVRRKSGSGQELKTVYWKEGYEVSGS